MEKNFIKPRVYIREQEMYYTAYIVPIVLSATLAKLLYSYNIPKQLTGIVFGWLVGILLYCLPRLEYYAELVWHADTVEVIYFPLLLLRLLCNIDMHIFLKSLHQILLISISTTFIPGLLVAFVILVMKGFEYTVVNIMLIGLIYSLNSVPIVLAIANPVKNFEVLLCSEAVFSLVWTLPMIKFTYMVELELTTSLVQLVCLSARSIILSTLLGIIVGCTVSMLFKYIYVDLNNTVSALVAVSYFTYCLCEFEGGCNGALGTTVALFFVLKEKSRLSTDTTPELFSIIQMIYSAVNGFITAGLFAIFVFHTIKFGSKSDVAPAIAAYILLNIMRAVTFLLLATILSRIGYGLNIESLWAMSLGMVKGTSQLIILLQYYSYGMHENLMKSLYGHIVILITLMSLVNELFGYFLLKAFGILKLSLLHQNNISIAIRNILENRLTTLSMIKMNRFFSDANWPIIYSFTYIKDPNLEKDGNLNDFTHFNGSIREAQCPSCHKTIAVEPTVTEFAEMTREVRLRVLKMNRVSFMRQFEQGIINAHELMGLLIAVEVAFDSQEKELKIDELLENFLTKTFVRKLKKCLLSSQVIKTELQPKTKCSRFCYKKSRSFKCLIPMYLIDVLYIVLATAILFDVAIPPAEIYFACVGFYVLFTAKEMVVILGLSIDSIGRGFRRYLRNIWNALDFSVLLVHFTELVLVPIFEAFEWHRGNEVYKYIRFVRILVLIKLTLLCERLFPKYLTCLENFTDSKICYSFTVGRSLIVSYDEVLNVLPSLCDNLNIRQTIKECLASKKLKILERLALIQKERPWISVTVETKQALGATLKGMQDGLEELKSAGYVDKHEYNLLDNVLKERQKFVPTYKSVDPLMPKSIFFEVGYLCDDQETLEYIYDNILMKVWKTGEIVCDIGELVPGIFVIVAGVVKMTYKPQEQYLKRLKDHGAIPMKKNLSNLNFGEEQVDYFMIGNSIGELSNLTQRENSCIYVAQTPCQAFIIPPNILNEAFKRSNDPVNGLEARMWKCLITDLAKKILLNTFTYHSLSQLTLNFESAIVPDLRRFKTLVLTDLVEDVILVDGIVVDYFTRDIYVAPCYVPRAVQRMILTDISVPDAVPTKLMILPIRDVSEYDVMLKAELQSDMISTSQTSLNYEPLAQYMQKKSIKRKVSLMMLKKSMGTKIFKGRPQVLNSLKTQKDVLDIV